MKLHLRSSAKVNLSLDILSRREDGYHELASVVHTIGIWDEIDLEVLPNGPIEFSCNREELSSNSNLCVRAVELWNKSHGSTLGARIHLEKNIPVGAGLGGGSGNAAAILHGLNHASGQKLSIAEIGELGAQLGADVPLFTAGGSVLMEGIGEKLSPLPHLEGWLLVVKPDVFFSTPAIYRAWDGGGFESVRGSEIMKGCVGMADLKQVANHLSNDLEKAAAQLSDIPALLIGRFNATQPLGAQMSGSGSACFAIFESEKKAQNASLQLKGELAKDVQLHTSQIFVAPFCPHGVQVAPRE